MKGDQFRLMDAAGEAGGAQAPNPAGSPPAAPPAGGAPAGSSNPAPGGPSLLAGGAGELDWLPEKYRVFGADQVLDLSASARKLADGYGELSKRMGSGELPPKDADGYDIKPDGLPEGLTLEDLKKDDTFKSFLKAAHGKGMTNAQVQFVMAEFYTRLNGLNDTQSAAGIEANREALGKVWADEATMKANLKQAHKAVSALTAKAGLSMADIESAGLGNNAAFLRIMAALGSEVGEAPGGGLPNDARSTASADDIKVLQSKLSDPKFDKDPERPIWQKRVHEHYARQPGGSQPIY